MSVAEPGEKLSFGEARRKVIDNMQACEAGRDAIELALGDDLDSLKTAEYALLAPIITRGLESYLAKHSPPDNAGHLNPVDLSTRIGVLLGNEVADRFREDPHRVIIDHFAKKRAVRLPRYAMMITPVELTLKSAAYFSATQLYAAAASNAIVIAKNGGMEGRPREEFIQAIKRSHQLALSAPLVHLEWNRLASEEITNHGANFIEGKPLLNDDALVYDPAVDKAVLKKPLESWLISPRETEHAVIETLNESPRQMNDHQPEDVRIGCPVSFDPSLVKRYYEFVVDMIEAHQAWPDMVADPEKLQARKLANLARLGLHPGVRI